MARTNRPSRRGRSSNSSGKKPNQNYSTNLASGGSVSVRDGVKTYSDKGLQVRGNGGISISGQSFSRDRDGSGFAPVIPSDKVSPVPPLKMPTATINDPGNLAQQMNTALAPSLAGISTLNPTTGMFDPVTGTPPAEPTPQSNLQAYLANLTAAQGSQPNAEVTLRQLEKESGLKQAKQDVNNYTGQLNAITAKSQADQLRLEGQGRGITDTLIGGQQAQINREAAIAALPVQAQLAAAQGNLQMAQEHVDKMFSIRMQDAQNKYALQTKIAEKLFDYANAEQARKMQDKKDADNRAFSVMQNDQSFARQLAMQAVEFGQTGLAAKLGNLVPSSATYAQDIGALQGQLRKPVAPRAATLRQTQVVDGKLIDTQTGEIIKDIGGLGVTLNGKAQTQTEKMVEGYGIRTLEAGAIINDSGSEFSKVKYSASQFTPNILKTENRQKFEQAERNYINAVLRRESGAVISPEEFTNARLQYFPQPGDSAGVLTQKKQNRETTTSNLFNEANVAMPGDRPVDGVTQLQVGFQGTTQSGLTYTIEK